MAYNLSIPKQIVFPLFINFKDKVEFLNILMPSVISIKNIRKLWLHLKIQVSKINF